MSRLTVFKWWKCFKEGNKMVIDDAVGRAASTLITDVGIRQLMYWWAEQKVNSMGIVCQCKCVIGKGSAHPNTAQDELHMISAMIRNQNVSQWSVTVLPEFCMITCDDSWIRHYDIIKSADSCLETQKLASTDKISTVAFLRKWCRCCFVFTPKALLFSIGYLGGTLWTVSAM